MAAELFEDIVDPSINVGSRQWYTVPLSILAHAVGLAGLVVVPLMAAGMLPTPESVLVFAATPPSPAPPPVEIHATPASPTTPLDLKAAPFEPPSRVVDEPPQAPPALTTIPSVHGGIPTSLPEAALRLAPPPEIAPPLFVRPGGAIKEPRKIHDVSPVYPAIAISAKAEGLVIVEAVIDKTGDVVDAKVLRSHPLLDQAALDAVRHWKFTPTLLNGVPVEVHMTVSVNFTLH